MFAIIVGAGLSGATIAERLASQGKSVLVLESRNHIAGNAHDSFREDSMLLESTYGVHLFHTNNERVWKYVQNFADWLPWEHKALGKIRKNNQDVFVPIPANITTVNTLFDSNIHTEDEMKEFLSVERSGQKRDQECTTSEEAGKARVGPRIFDALFKDYTFKQWGIGAEKLNASVLRRIPIRENFDDRYFNDTYQALPKKGYTEMVKKMLSNPLIEVRTGVDYFSLRNEIASDYVFYTGPVDRYFEGCGLPKLQYRSITFERFVKDNDGVEQPCAMVNYPSMDTPYTRSIEYKHLLNQTSTKTSIVFETTNDYGDPYYPIPSEENQELHKQYLKLVENIELQYEPKVRFIGRLATYKYLNMDEAISEALNLFDREFD